MARRIVVYLRTSQCTISFNILNIFIVFGGPSRSRRHCGIAHAARIEIIAHKLPTRLYGISGTFMLMMTALAGAKNCEKLRWNTKLMRTRMWLRNLRLY